MAERFTRFEGFRQFDVGIKSWTKMAEEIIGQFGQESILEYPAVVPLTGIPKLTGGAYSCYAGVTKSPTSGLYVFHLTEIGAYSELVKAIGGEPIGGMVGGIPLNIPRRGPDEFEGKSFVRLDPKHASLGGFNLMVLPSKEVLYAAGYFNASEIAQ
ncbi:hypothetical protein HZA76_04760 [Candidatus Roizmanbacteria bacterium]|nr:hypothetical protein [Candidatus Roizmanbacteria bacterium]